jgi:hypothetical protein
MPTHMTSPWTIRAAADRVELDDAGKAEATFTVTNNGPIDQRIAFDVVTADNADRSWFTVAQPQVLIKHGGSFTFLVNVVVPAGTPAGATWFAGRAYSADAAPEETAVVSDRVACEIKPSEPPPPPWWKRLWWVFVIAALALVTIVVVLFVLLGGDDPPPPQNTETEVPVPTEVRKTTAISYNQNELIDLDEIAVVASSPFAGTSSDVHYRPLLPSDGIITAINGASLVKIGPTADPAGDCARAAVDGTEVRVSQWKPGEVVCVRTNAGRPSMIVLDQKRSALSLPPPPPQLLVTITTFEPPGGS